MGGAFIIIEAKEKERGVIMKRSMTAVSALLLMQTMLSLFFSGFSGILRELSVVLAYLLPLLLLATPFFRSCEKNDEIGFSVKNALRFMPIFPFFLTCVIIISLVTSILSGLVGYEPSPVIPADRIFLSVFGDMLIPAICEELLCRYAVLKLLSPYGKGGAVFVSAFLFAFMHANFYQMPYAFFAGLMLASLTLASKSMVVPIIFHVLNNLVSVALFYLPQSLDMYICLALIALLPISFILALRRGVYSECVKNLSDGSASAMLLSAVGSPLIFYALLMLAYAV